MAYYMNGATHSIRLGSASATAAPLTMAGWLKMDNHNDSLNHMLVALQKTSGGGAANGFYLNVDNRGGAARRAGFVAYSTAFNTAQSSTLISNSGWHHLAGVAASATSRTAYLNGGGAGTNTTSTTPTSIDDTTIGLYVTQSATLHDNVAHQVAEVGIWNAALTAAEIAALAKGFSPPLVRPQNLVFYAPLMREAINRKGGTLTIVGASVVAHPSIINQTRPQIIRPSVAVGGSFNAGWARNCNVVIGACARAA